MANRNTPTVRTGAALTILGVSALFSGCSNKPDATPSTTAPPTTSTTTTSAAIQTGQKSVKPLPDGSYDVECGLANGQSYTTVVPEAGLDTACDTGEDPNAPHIADEFEVVPLTTTTVPTTSAPVLSA